MNELVHFGTNRALAHLVIISITKLQLLKCMYLEIVLLYMLYNSTSIYASAVVSCVEWNSSLTRIMD